MPVVEVAAFSMVVSVGLVWVVEVGCSAIAAVEGRAPVATVWVEGALVAVVLVVAAGAMEVAMEVVMGVHAPPPLADAVAGKGWRGAVVVVVGVEGVIDIKVLEEGAMAIRGAISVNTIMGVGVRVAVIAAAGGAASDL